MTDRPILFSAPMIRALLDGRKTQTRRILKLPTKGQYIHPQRGGWEATTVGGGAAFTIERDGTRKPAPEMAAIWHRTTGKTITTRWQKGDRLWVRETWRTMRAHDGDKPGDLTTDLPSALVPISYEADGNEGLGALDGKTRVAIHMPRWASRLTLTVTDVRVQRLLDISNDDAEAEGFKGGRMDDGFGPRDIGGGFTVESPGSYANAVGMFLLTWQKLHPEWDGYSDTWVVALTFTVERQNIDAFSSDRAPAVRSAASPF